MKTKLLWMLFAVATGVDCGADDSPTLWSLQPPICSDLDASRIDDFIAQKLSNHGLATSPEAPPTILLRRLYFDLIGLPPTPQQAAGFSLAKLEETVDALLQSPRFGERWGKHWLDVARYAESNGRESNLTFPHAWRYRDYVIDAVNADVPFDRFITEQIAGDLLPAKDEAERARLLIATGFLAMGAKGLNEMNKSQFAADLADEQLDTVTRAVLASSIACARCHDHKTDPFSMEDYYALAGIFMSTQTFYGTWVDSENNNGSHLIKLPRLPGEVIPNKSVPPATVTKLRADMAKLNQDEADQTAYALKAKEEGRDISSEYYKMLTNSIRILWQRGGIEGQLETVDDQGNALPLCMGVQDLHTPYDSPIFDRGEIAHPKGTVPRGVPKVFHSPISVPHNHSGRLELAHWLTSPQNPLTARVMVNRIWRHLLGSGLVRTVDNFGETGEKPSHPELLDYLAVKFMKEGWSVKKIIREIVLSQTYRQASTHNEEAFNKDPDNRFRWRANKRRLDAEVIRDSMLAISNRLELSRRRGSLVAELGGQSVSLMGFNTSLPQDLDGSRHRSVYLPVIRDHLPDVLEQFDAANPNLVTGDRDVTNVPLQALYLLNGPFVQDQANALAERLRSASTNRKDQIRRAFSLCFNRPPDAEELRLAESFFQLNQAEEPQLLAAFCQSLLASAEFRYAD